MAQHLLVAALLVCVRVRACVRRVECRVSGIGLARVRRGGIAVRRGAIEAARARRAGVSCGGRGRVRRRRAPCACPVECTAKVRCVARAVAHAIGRVRRGGGARRRGRGREAVVALLLLLLLLLASVR